MRQLVVIDKMNLGGVTSSLLNYLSYSSRFHSIDLLVFNNKPLPGRIPSNVNILKAPQILRIFGESQHEIRNVSILLATIRSLLVIISRLFGGHYARKFVFSFVKGFGTYDLAISYTHDVSWKSLTTGCNDFVLRKVEASHKATFVHCDYVNYGGYDKKSAMIYEKFDTIACVSCGCKKSFLTCFPELVEKTVVCENFINIDIVKVESTPIVPFGNKTHKLVTACRIQEEKGVFRIVEVSKRLRDEGFRDFEWRVIGDGPHYEQMLDMINRYKLSDNIKMVGRQDPPYRYMTGATLFVLPSFHEAAPMVFGECRVLKIPVLSTKTTSAEELVSERKLGLVCDNTTEAIYEEIKQVFIGKKMLPILDNNTAESTNVAAEKYYWQLDERIKR